MAPEYNTTRPELILKEYGRNIQKLVAYVKTVEDPETRSRHAKTLTDLMKQINPALKDNPEYNQKLWDDLFIISDFDLDIESPFPIPEKSVLDKKPQRLAYKQGEVSFRHYGRNVELMIEKAIEMEDAEEKEASIIYIGKLMKNFYASFNKDGIDEEVIIGHINQLSKGALNIDAAKVKENNLFNSNFRERKPRENGGKENREYQNKRRNFKGRRRG